MELLWAALQKCYGDAIGEPAFSAEAQWDFSRDQEMRKHGWCPFLSFQLRYHFSTFESLEKDGLIHRAECSGCEERGVDDDQLAAMIMLLKEGRLPLLRLNYISEADFKVEVVPFTGRQRYIAVSHVWADGLGNPNANSLRSYAEARSKSIALMYTTYKDAHRVLMLDRELQSITTSHMEETEIADRVLSCGWTRRLWTFQEVVLAQHPWIQFADGPQDLHALAHNIERIANSASDHDLRQQTLAKGLYRGLWGLISTEKQFNLSRVVRGIEDRLVTRPSDEPLCIAPLLGLDVEPIARAKGKDRIKAFWEGIAKSQHGIPKNIIFAPIRKLRFPGFQWAPLTLRHRMMWQWMSTLSLEKASLMEDGLHVKFAGGKLRPSSTIPTSINSEKLRTFARRGDDVEKVYVVDDSGRWWEFNSYRVIKKIKKAWLKDARARDSTWTYSIILQNPTSGIGPNGGTHRGLIVRHLNDDGMLVQLGVDSEVVRLIYRGPVHNAIMQYAHRVAQEIQKERVWRTGGEDPEAAIHRGVCKLVEAQVHDASELKDLYEQMDIPGDERVADLMSKVLLILAGIWVSTNSSFFSSYEWTIHPESVGFEHEAEARQQVREVFGI
ncbi:MAG: hypothetical protein Q9159_001539 [Coniocarpon cinnabarinum]